MNTGVKVGRLRPQQRGHFSTPDNTASFIGYTVRALKNWRVRGGGPRFVKVSARSIRYRRRDLIAWAEALLVSITSDMSKAA